jgi:hypothetical protein
MVRSRMESIDETLMGKHTAHHLQQVERGLYDLLEKEKEQMLEVSKAGCFSTFEFEQYYNETYK